MAHQIYGIEGLDRLGKSTLIQGIQDAFGYYQVVHFSKPNKLKIYEQAAKKESFQGDGPVYEVFHNEDGTRRRMSNNITYEAARAAYHYQSAGFRNSMVLARSSARIIFDRWHIGEAVYSPMYRGYSGDYVFDQERAMEMHTHQSCRLILLVEDFSAGRHFKDDGNSLGPVRNRPAEQELFLNAFSKSTIFDKKIICVTNQSTGEFRRKEDILKEAVS